MGNEKEEKTREKRVVPWEKKRDLYREKTKKSENKFVFCTILGNEKEEETREKKSYGKKLMGKDRQN